MIRYAASGWYCDAIPGGSFAILHPDAFVETSQGQVPLPSFQNVLFLVCALVKGKLCLAGQGGNDGQAWLWNGDQWHAMCPSYGTSPCIFGPQGLYVSTPGAQDNIKGFDPLTFAPTVTITKPLGARGIAAITGAGLSPSDLHGQDDWYGQHGLAEYVDLAGIQIGQGKDGGCVAAGYGLLEPGNVQFIRAHRQDSNLAVAMWKPDDKQAVVIWLTVGDLVTLPPLPVPGPIPVPVPVPIPEPVPMSGITDAQFATLQAERAKFPTGTALTPEQIGTILNATAYRHRNDPGFRLGLQAKSSGTAAIQPKTGTRVWNGLRIINAQGQHWGEDVCGGCSVGQFNPVRAMPGPADSHSFVAPVDTGGVIDPPQPPPTQPADDIAELRLNLATLDAKINAVVQATQRALEQVDLRLTAVELKVATTTPPVSRLRVRGQSAAAGANILARAHSHGIDLIVDVVPE